MWSRPRSASTTRRRPRRAAGSGSIPPPAAWCVQGTLHRRPHPAQCPRARPSMAPRRSRRTAATRCASRRTISSSPPRASAAAGQTPAPFTQITPTQSDDGNLVAYLAEDSEYDDEQARLAGIQRLLVIAGYDAAPIDGVDGPKTQARARRVPEEPRAAADMRAVAEFLHHHDRRGAVAVRDRAHLVQRHAAQDHGGGRDRRRQGR